MSDNTTIPTQKNNIHKWHFINADGRILGRLSVDIANKLTGKEKVLFTRNINVGDKVVVINAEKIKVTGKKLKDKKYIHHTGYPKGLREENLESLLSRKPADVIYKAVKNMLPNNKLRKVRMANLFIYKGPEHPHQPQMGKKK